MSQLTIFFDTEFTDLEAPYPGLMSIGMVSSNGHELYIVIEPSQASWLPEQVSYFVEETVIPLLYDHSPEALSMPAAKARILAWMESLRTEGQGIDLRSDSEIDWLLFRRLIGKMPSYINWQRIGSRFVGPQQEAFDGAYEAYFQVPDRHEHHALEDARAIVAGMAAVEALNADVLKNGYRRNDDD